MRAFAGTKGAQGWWQAIKRSKDPPSFIVLFEDSAAIFGLVVAAIGLVLVQVTGNPCWDGIASIVIGCALAGVAFVLARESKGLLIGERADPKLARLVREVLDRPAEVTGVGAIVTVQIAPDRVFVAADVDFEDEVRAGDVERIIAEAEAELRAALPEIASLYVKPKAKG